MVVGSSPPSPSSTEFAADVTAKRTASEALNKALSGVQSHPEDGQSWEALYVAWATVGEVAAAWNALQEWARRAPGQIDVMIRSIQFLLGTKDTQQALTWAKQALHQHPDHETLLKVGMDAALMESEWETAHQWASQLLHHHPSQSVFTARVLSRADQWSMAMHVLEQWLSHHPDDASAWALMAELHLWAGTTEAAETAALRALQENPPPILAQVVVAALRFRSQEYAQAWSILEPLEPPTRHDEVVELEASTLWCWKSLVQYEMGDLDGAVKDAERALHSPGPLNLAAQILRSKMMFHQNMARSSHRQKKRAGFEVDPMKRVVDIWSYREILPRIEPLLTVPNQAWSGIQGDLLDAYTRSLAQLGNNLSSSPTLCRPAGSTPRRFVPSPLVRAKARQLQHLLRTRSADTVLEMYRDLQQQHPDAITPHTYMGEVLIWLGRTAEAKRQLHQAIDRDLTTQWAWIGLGAAALLEQQPERAIELFAEGIEHCRFEGPTMFVYRAECWFKLGRLDQARQDIDVALSSKPQRLSAWLLRAQIDSARDDKTLANALTRLLAERVPHLSQAMTAKQRSLTESIEWALLAMKGNRSSSLPFFHPSNSTTLSFLRWRPQDWQSLRAHLPLDPPIKQPIWWEAKPEGCRLGNCGPRCRGREQLQAWMGPAVGLDRQIQYSKASQQLKDHTRVFLNHLQAQRRQDCPDLPDLAQRAEVLMDAIGREKPSHPEIIPLCKLLSSCLH